MLEQKHQVFLRLGVAGENDFSTVCSGEMDVEHLHGGELFEDSAWSQSAGARFETGLEGDLQAIGEEGDENVRFNAAFKLVVNGSDRQVAFEFFKCLFDFGELEVVFPKFCGIVSAQVRAQQVAAFPAAGYTEVLSVEAIGEGHSLLFPFAVNEDFHVDVA